MDMNMDTYPLLVILAIPTGDDYTFVRETNVCMCVSVCVCESMLVDYKTI